MIQDHAKPQKRGVVKAVGIEESEKVVGGVNIEKSEKFHSEKVVGGVKIEKIDKVVDGVHIETKTIETKTNLKKLGGVTSGVKKQTLKPKPKFRRRKAMWV